METQLVEKIVHEVKSQGVFDEFRKDSMADVDTKPAYQNLRQRVETTVKKFLSEQIWTPETNKNQLREKLRRHITESGFLDVGVERIVDQVVNPKIGSVFQPRIEEIAYNYLGLPPPPKKYEPPPPPLMHPLPPLPIAPPPLKVETCSLLPNDLEQVSPDSDKATVKSEIEGDDKTQVDMDMEDKILDDEDESPPFEPLATKEEDIRVKQEITIVKTELEDSTLGDIFKKENANSNSCIKSDLKEEIDSQESNNVTPEKADKEVTHSMDCRVFQDSQLSSVSSDTRLTPETKEDSSLLRSSQEEAATANISEEAQMPKFNENSSEPSSMNGCKKDKDSELHFDIKKDEIKFEGTERKTNVDNNTHISPLSDDNKCPLSAETSLREYRKSEEFKFVSNNNINNANVSIHPREDDGDRTPIADELSFGSSIDNSTSISPDNTDKITTNYKEKFMSMQDKSPQPITLKVQQPLISTPTQTTPTTTPTETPTPPMPFTHTPTPTPSPLSTQKTMSERDQQNSRHSTSSSSSKHKKHSKERRRSMDRERDKDRYRSSSSKDNNKYRGSSGGYKGSSSKHYSVSTKNSSSSSSHNKSSSDKDRERDMEKSSSSSHSLTKHSKHSSADKRHHHSSSSTHNNRDHSSSSSTTSTKRNERKDDHHEAKHKAQRRKSTDSNDDDKGSGGGRAFGANRTSSQHNKSGGTSSTRTKSKSSNDVNQSPSNNTNGTQNDQMATESNVNFEKPHIKNNVVFLNNLLENPQTQFIELDTHGHTVEGSKSDTQQQCTTNFAGHNHTEDPTVNNTSELLSKYPDLLYFEDIESTFMERFHLLNETMDLCRRSVNCLRFEAIDEGIELSSEDDYSRSTAAPLNCCLSVSLKRKSNVNYEEFEKTPRKRCIQNKSDECPLKTSPSPSDSSVNSKENEEIDKNTDQLKKLERNKAAAAAVQKLSQQQRYTSDDLYKPRPILGQRSRRRGMDSIV